MTHAKKLKREIRARSAKTGESYTAARRQILLARRKPEKPASKPAISDASIAKATGHGLDYWFGVLDAFNTPPKGHTAMAAHLNEEHGVRGWHSQMITVVYERARGLRTMNQSCDGDFQVSLSKAVAGSVSQVVSALRGGGWLDGVDPELSRAFPKSAAVVVRDPNTAKLRYKWGASIIDMRITAKKGGSTVAVGNMKLADAAEVEKRRSQWRGALESLKAFLAK